jgi:hypothetical protein
MVVDGVAVTSYQPPTFNDDGAYYLPNLVMDLSFIALKKKNLKSVSNELKHKTFNFSLININFNMLKSL